jgi:hypothetical protein
MAASNMQAVQALEDHSDHDQPRHPANTFALVSVAQSLDTLYEQGAVIAHPPPALGSRRPLATTTRRPPWPAELPGHPSHQTRARVTRVGIPDSASRTRETTSMSLAPPLDDQDWLTTTEAAALIGRTQSAVRAAINNQALPGFRHDGRNYVRRADLLAWDQRTRRAKRHCVPAYEHTAQLLREYQSATTPELAELSQLHPGNIRKHLAILATQGRVECRPDGQWVLTPDPDTGAA